MGRVTLTVNGKRYDFVCEDGEETRLATLAAIVEKRITAIIDHQGEKEQAGEARLLLMAALTLADEIQRPAAAPSPATKKDDARQTIRRLAALSARIEAL